MASRLGRCLRVAAIAALPAAGASAAERQAWIENSVRVDLGDRWQASAAHELRGAEFDYEETLLQNVAVGLTRKLPGETSLGVFYKREKEETPSGTRTEDRPYVDLGWRRVLAPSLELDGRVRTELRRFRRDAANDVVRFRFRMGLRAEATLLGLRIAPFVWTEVFTGHEQPLRNRLSIGAAVRLVPHVDLVVGWVHQATRGAEPLHAPRLGLELSF